MIESKLLLQYGKRNIIKKKKYSEILRTVDFLITHQPELDTL